MDFLKCQICNPLGPICFNPLLIFYIDNTYMVIKDKVIDLLHFLKTDIWKTSDKECSLVRAFFIRQTKIILLAIHKFAQKRTRVQAAAMTYYSTLALVPSLTLIYGLMKGFGLESTFRDQLETRLSSHKELIDAIFTMAQSYVDKTQGTIFAGLGVALLLWGVFKTLSTMEDAFNNIWGVEEHKPVLRKLSDYLTVFLICPLLIILSGSLTVYVSTQVHHFTLNIFNLGPLAPIIYTALFFLPFMVISLVFTFIYIFMPNTKVKFTAGLLGGFVAGALYQVVQWTYIIFQGWINSMNAIYGSLAAIPLFLVWLQLSWMIILFGSEVAFGKQYFKTYEFEPEDIVPSPALRKQVALLLVYMCIKDFKEGKPPCLIQKMAEHLHLPASLAQEVAADLANAGIMTRVHFDDNKIFAYQPGMPIDTITIETVLDSLEHLGQEDIPIKETEEFKVVTAQLERLKIAQRVCSEKVLLKDL
jgi:membrane protein